MGKFVWYKSKVLNGLRTYTEVHTTVCGYTANYNCRPNKKGGDTATYYSYSKLSCTNVINASDEHGDSKSSLSM